LIAVKYEKTPEFMGMGVGLPAAVDFVLVVALQGAYLVSVLRFLGSTGSERNLIAFAAGLVVPIAAFGLISEISLPLALLPALAFVLFPKGLWKEYPVARRPTLA